MKADQGGSVTSTPDGIACPGRCTATFSSGTRVTLHAAPSKSWAFSRWDGSCSGKTRDLRRHAQPRPVGAGDVPQPVELAAPSALAATATPAFSSALASTSAEQRRLGRDDEQLDAATAP